MKKTAVTIPDGVPGCPGCRALRALVLKLLARVEALEERLGTNSRNSHTPPCKDPPDAPSRPKKENSDRKPGGQLGHRGKKRELLPPDQVDEVVHHILTECERCGATLPPEPGRADPPPSRYQVVEVPQKLFEIWEHQGHARTCTCGHVTRASIPPDVLACNFGPRLVAISGFLSGSCHLSKRQVQEVLRDVFGVPVALGSVVNMEAETTKALEPPYQEAGEWVRNAPAKNLDETGWKVRGAKSWLWVAGTATVCQSVIPRFAVILRAPLAVPGGAASNS